MAKTRDILEELAVAWRKHQQFQKDLPGHADEPDGSNPLRDEASANWNTIMGLLDENAKE